MSGQDPEAMECLFLGIIDIERTTTTRLVNPEDQDLINKTELWQLNPTSEHHEVTTCIRADSSYRMVIVNKRTSISGMQSKLSSPARMVFDNGLVSSYDTNGELVNEMAWDQSSFQALMFQSALQRAGVGRNWQAHIDSILSIGGSVGYPTSSTAVLTYPAVLGGIITETVDLDAGALRSFEIHNDDGSRRIYIENTFEKIGQKIILKKSITKHWDTLPISSVRFVQITEEIYHKFEY